MLLLLCRSSSTPTLLHQPLHRPPNTLLLQLLLLLVCLPLLGMVGIQQQPQQGCRHCHHKHGPCHCGKEGRG